MKILYFAKATVALFMLANFVTIAMGDSATVPSDLKASAASCVKISLSWTATADQVSVWKYYDNPNKSFPDDSAFIGSSVNSYDDTVQPGRTYCYKIHAEKCIAYENEVCKTKDIRESTAVCPNSPPPSPVTPGKPQLSINHGENNLTVYLTWIINPNGNVPNACVKQDGFEIWRQSGSSPMALYQYYSTNSYLVTGIQNGVQYSYQVRAYLSTLPTVYSGFSPATPVSVTEAILTTGISGNGSVNGTSGLGINCPSDCKEMFAAGTPITLTATPAAGHKFMKWQGGSCNLGNPCSFTINSTTNITAFFEADKTPPVVSLTSPTVGQTRMGAINFAAQASDDVKVTKVEFYANTTLVGTVTTAPYQSRVNWNPQLLPYGSYDFTANAYDAAGNVGVSTPVKASVKSGQLILNSSFEPQVTEWTASNGVISNGPTTIAHSGAGYASLHLANIAGATDNIYQQITIPADAVTADLSFWMRVDSSAPSGTVSYDKLTVTVRDTAGNILGTLGTYSSINKTANYTENRFDMSAYKGKTIGLYFQSTKPSSPLMLPVDDDVILSSPLDKSLRFYLDDVTLNVTQ
ncbi:MAG: Ig-like domain-containing protein [Proteobacteria bacterium]|nr:Ig-like domain-containing protein [Pseudomonadota bacterium]